MSASSTLHSAGYSSCSSDESYDPFDRYPDYLASLKVLDAYYEAGPGRDVNQLDPPVSLEIKEKVKAVDPCQGRCLITNATPDSGIKYTHCLPVHLSETSDLVHRLEWHWGMRMNKLDLGSEYNIFPVSAQLSAMHEFPRRAPSWFLLPEDHIVDLFYSRIEKFDINEKPCDVFQEQVYSKACRGNLPEIREKTFKYRLFPMLQRMEGMALYHVQHPPIRRPTLSDFTFGVYPFNNLPWVTSHLDPKFVIMEAGRKLNLMDGWELKWGGIYDEFFASHPSLRRLLLLYEAWSAPIPADAYKDPGFIPSTTIDAQAPPASSSAAEVDCNVGSGTPNTANHGSGWDPSAIAQWSINASS